MEQFLSTIFPCCFPNRHNRPSNSRHSAFGGDANERTPLIGNASGNNAGGSGGSIHDSGSDGVGGASTPGRLDAKRLRRKQNSILPSPAYDANVLKSIIDDFKGKLIAVDTAAGGTTAEKGGAGGGVGLLLNGAAGLEDKRTVVEEQNVETEEQKDDQPAAAQSTNGNKNVSPTELTTKHVIPVHTLRITFSNPGSSSSLSSTTVERAERTKLVDIWSTPTLPATSASSSSSPAMAPTEITSPPASKLSYSAAVKRGSSTATTKKGRFGTAASKSTPSSSPSLSSQAGAEEVSVEQKTYEVLAGLVRSKPLVHDWDLEDEVAS